jgi:DNA-binding beta-propeller fold protein YncE
VAATYTIGGSVSGLASGAWVVLLNNGHDNLTVQANGNYTFPTSMASGAVYNVTIGAQPIGQTCSITHASDSVLSSNISNVDVSCVNNAPPPPTTHTVGGTVTGLAAGQSVTLLDNGGDNLTVNASGVFTFATGLTAGASYAVTVGAQPVGQTCTVTNGSGTMASSNVTSVAVSCSSHLGFAYAANANSNDVSQYVIASDGGLLPITPASVPAGNYPTSVAVDPTRRYAYVANLGGSSVSQYTVGIDGTLSPMTPVATVSTGAGSQPVSVTVDPTGRYAYVVLAGSSGYIAQYAIGTGGALTPLSPATVTAGNDPIPIVIDPTGHYAYVGNLNDNTVSQFSIGSGGGLVPLSPATVPTGTLPQGIAVDPTGRYVYVTNYGAGNSGGNNVSQYTIGAGGALTPMTPATVVVGSGSSCPVGIAVDPTGSYVYVANNCTSTIAQFTIGTGGALSAMSPATIPMSSTSVGITMDPTGHFVYVTNGNGNIAQYSLGAGGSLVPLSPTTVPAGNYPYAITTAH